MCSMVSTLTKLGEGAFAEVFGCQNEDKEKLALKVQSQYIVPPTVQEYISEPHSLSSLTLQKSELPFWRVRDAGLIDYEAH